MNTRKIILGAAAVIGITVFIVLLISWTKNEKVAYDPYIPRWVKVTKSYTDFSTAATTNDIEIYSLPAKAVLHTVTMKHTTAFAGGSISAYSLSVGRSGSLDIWVNGSSVFGPVSGATFYTSETFPTPINFGSSTSIRSQAIAVGGNLNTATFGAVEYYLLISNLP